MATNFITTSLSFLTIISIIIFIHELGHYLVAKISGVKIEVFSIGFGKTLFSWHDKSGTNWKISILPLGGYVRMYGDNSAASDPDLDKISKMNEEEKQLSFYSKPLITKSLIIAAGPIANFLLSIIIFTGIFSIYGKATISSVISQVQKDSSADLAGLQINDKIIKINNKYVKDFSDIEYIVSNSSNQILYISVSRDGEHINKKLTPKLVEAKDIFGNKTQTPKIGVVFSEIDIEQYSIAKAIIIATKYTYKISIQILSGLGEIITGKRNIDELGGPITIAKYSGESIKDGLKTVLWFMAILSVNLGLMNLIPIPVLDGGHLLFYFIEMIIRKPIPKNIQHYSFKFGIAALSFLMILCTINDLKKIFFN